MPDKHTDTMFLAFVVAITLATVLSIVGYIFQRPDTTTQHIFQIASELVTGALGFFAGRASAPKPPETGGPQ